MGIVYAGFDETLQRRVALKVVHSEFRLDADSKARFLREARILSQLDHPGICRVYDYIDGDENDILVLELVEGTNLRQALRRGLDEHQKVDIAKQLLEVLVAVHGEGVVHRDLKPENVMLTPQGGIKVLDFGLARSADEDPDYTGPTQIISKDPGQAETDSINTAAFASRTMRLQAATPELRQRSGTPGSGSSRSTYVKTSHGMVLGTAGYMSPEQARGEPATAASDMYSLGLILQELFTGRGAFETGLSPLELLQKAARGETLQVDNLPSELKALIDRLKSPEPAARPIAVDAAERFGWIQDAPRRRRRRQFIAAAWMVVALFAVVSSFQAFRLSNARNRERLASRFGTEVQRIDSLMRFAHLAPLHDLSEDRERVRRRVASIPEHLQDVGDWGIGPGLFAVGRGYLALGEYEKAHENLQKAWESGYREPEAAYALGVSLGALYHRGLDQLRFITDEARRAEEKARIESELRDPAIRFLKACAGVDSLQSDYVEGLLALHEGRFDEALASAARCEERASWQYEGHLLEGRARFLLARDLAAQGQHENATEDFTLSAAAFAAAAEIGESDPRCYTGLCLVWTAVMEMRLYGAGGDLEEAFGKAMTACDSSLVADRRQSIVLNGQWACYRMLAESKMHRDPEQAAKALESAQDAAGELVEMDPDSALAHQEYGLTMVLSSILATRNGGDGTGDGIAAVASLERAAEIDPASSGVWLDLGNAHQYLGAAMEAQGHDSTRHYLQAATAFRRSVELRPDFVFAFNNLAALELMLANLEQERGADPQSHADEAIHNAKRALELKPDHLYALANLAGAHLIKGKHLTAAGDDPTASFDHASQAAVRARDLNPDYLPAYLYIAEAALELARYRITHREGADDLLTVGLEAVAGALQRAPGLDDALTLKKDLNALAEGPRH